MKFSVGYQLQDSSTFIDTIVQNKEHISEVYFAASDFANGRGATKGRTVLEGEAAELRKKQDIKRISESGIGLNLLFNGNCYGKDTLSREFYYKIGDTVDELKNELNLVSVTTTSPLIARFIKQNFEDLDVRASVNMSIGTVEGLDYLADLFDSFYIAREHNRDLAKIKEIRAWCDQNGKKLYTLANSGCLNHCSAHTFHDNLVSHEAEISHMDNAYDFEGQCFTYLKNRDKRERWLNITNFIRPEDVHLYEGLFDGMKLATRVNRNPSKIIRDYVKSSASGAVTSLLEPDHSGLFYPFIIENSKIDKKFTETVLNCNKQCNACGYCNEVLLKALVNCDIAEFK